MPSVLIHGIRLLTLITLMAVVFLQQHALSDDDPMLEMTPQERRRLERQQELEADLANASDLLGAAAIAGQ